MKPSKIFHSQDSIKEKYDGGHTIYSTLSACKKHPFVINKIQRIRVCQKMGKCHSRDQWKKHNSFGTDLFHNQVDNLEKKTCVFSLH